MQIIPCDRFGLVSVRGNVTIPARRKASGQRAFGCFIDKRDGFTGAAVGDDYSPAGVVGMEASPLGPWEVWDADASDGSGIASEGLSVHE